MRIWNRVKLQTEYVVMDEGAEEEEEYELEERKKKKFKLQNQFIFGFIPHSHYVIYSYALPICNKKYKWLGGEASLL